MTEKTRLKIVKPLFMTNCLSLSSSSQSCPTSALSLFVFAFSNLLSLPEVSACLVCLSLCLYHYLCMSTHLIQLHLHVRSCMVVCACMCVYLCVCLYVCVYMCMCVCSYVCVRVCEYACVYDCMRMCMYVDL